MKQALTYDDIQLVPKYSDITSRSSVSLKTLVSRRYGLLRPIVASPMDTVCGFDMALKMTRLGGVGCVHRFMSIEEQCEVVRMLQNMVYNISSDAIYDDWGVNYDNWHAEMQLVPIMAAVGVRDEDRVRATELVKSGANIILIDVAHGHHLNVIKMIEWCKKNLPDRVDVIAGSIATAKAAIDLENAGADGLRVGVGGGCFTPNMEVKTDKGFIKIKDIEVGTNVYTHTGELKPVNHKFIYDDYDEIYDIDGIEATANHKFYVVHQSKADLVTNDTIHDYAEWIRADKLTDEYFLIELD